MPAQDITDPTDENSVDVTLRANDPTAPQDLTLYAGSTPITEINFPADKKYIRFTFPDGYSDFDIRVFEVNETLDKGKVMGAYKNNSENGINEFNNTWHGNASSSQFNREFKLRSSQQEEHTMVLRDQDKDGTEDGTLHSYILRFTYGSKQYLLDPSIRNKQMS